MSWEKELEELRARETLAEKMGGADKVARQHSRGKMDARARLAALVDDGSFREIGKIAGKGSYDEEGNLTGVLPAPFLFGKALINGRPVVATADDFTIRGGAADAGISRKMVQAEKMAHELRLPIIRMIDGTGGGGSVKTLEQIGATYIPAVPGWSDVVQNLDTVPVVALALGPTAGLGAARTVASHYSVMVKGLSQIFAAGPAVVDGLGESYKGSVDHQQAKEDLGGSAIHTRNGVIDDEVASEAEAFARARHFLSFMPEHVGQLARRAKCTDRADRREEELLSLVPREDKQVYSMRRCLEMVFDRGTVFEIGRMWGRACITALARLDGWPVMVLASDPSYLGGSWDAKTSEKVERFVKLADQFRLPIVHLVDNPGFMIGREAETAGTIRYGVQAMNAVYKASVPLASVVLRRAYGIAGSAMSNAETYQYRYCWPSGDWGSLPIAGGLEVAYKSDLEAAKDPAAELDAIRARLDKVTSPFRSAERFNVEDIIDPRDTRPLLCEFAGLAWRRLESES
ncbi:acyl-CoA carboxylase subunit beta [Qipengyuania flava]|uniref:acyl-CoA carboxylase subunit beta n=1 Tax=Qipengyuania flava TaxID=192812 RepID=UPI001C563495|nr:carboxyl transferase domain-containing protein [Qipengyuania flava]MBW3167406.1 methylmalonyl-CoA carboxyltransferase [Qipengyuania flava]MBY5964644.1 methylmalonyl-CoA carboxyltransferase [Qipengyuania flava]MBY6010968.1 methylmalonyl-CoA carboxyltransferase [Qipengyuania flava]MBY6025410.1 methylmalonyl-CoA carboxyltransferase [Qipengyuania flava]